MEIGRKNVKLLFLVLTAFDGLLAAALSKLKARRMVPLTSRLDAMESQTYVGDRLAGSGPSRFSS